MCLIYCRKENHKVLQEHVIQNPSDWGHHRNDTVCQVASPGLGYSKLREDNNCLEGMDEEKISRFCKRIYKNPEARWIFSLGITCSLNN